MSRNRTVTLVVALLASAVVVVPSAGASGPGDAVDLLVKFAPAATAAQRGIAIAAIAGNDKRTIADIGVHVVSVPAQAADHALATLHSYSQVAFAERDAVLQPQEQLPNDPYFLNSGAWNIAGGAWGWYQTHTTQAWDITQGDPSVVVAILDTGIKTAGLNDLSGQISSTWNAMTGTTDATTNAGNHGTYVAGVAGLSLGNGTGNAGVCPHCKLMVVQVGTDSGATVSNIAAGLTYAADHGARVANMSWAGSTDSATLQSATTYAHNKGVVMTASAGNSNCNCVTYPAADPYVLGIAGTSSSGAKAGDSNYGSWVKLAAPEGDVTSWPSLNGAPGYASFGGTSSAAPFAAGIAGLLFSYNPALSNTQVEQALESSAVPVSFGVQYGRVDALAALQSVGATDPQSSSAPVQTAAPQLYYEVNGLGSIAPLSGAPQTGQVLVRGIGGWSGSAGLAVSNLQWQRCTSAGTGCAYVTNAGTYTVTSADAGSTIKLSFTVSNPVGSVAASVLSGVVGGAATPPANTTPPSVAGNAVAGQTLTASTGVWSGNPTSYSYAWADCDATGANCSAVAGATGSTYQVQSNDVARTIRVTVTAANAGGASSATSAATAAVTAVAPTSTSAPSISGQATVGQTLAVSTGGWTGTSPMTFGYQWSRCDSTGANCVAVAGATGSTYLLGTADQGSTVAAAVTATNQAGSATARSDATTLVQATAGGGGTTTVTTTFTGALSAKTSSSQSFTLTAGSGPVTVSLALTKSASAALQLVAADGTVVAKASGSGTTLAVSATVAAGSYSIVVSGTVKGNDGFTVTATATSS
jgi:subtilisin family serine protease